MYSLHPVFKHTGIATVKFKLLSFDSDVPINLYYLTLALTLEYLNIQEYVLALSHFKPAVSFSFWHLTTTPCRCRGLLWQLIYSVTQTHTQKASSGRRIETSTWQYTALKTDWLLCRRLGAGFEPAIPESKRPQIHTFDRAASGIGPSVP